MKVYHYLSVFSGEAAVALSVNDVVLVADPTGDGITTAEPINVWLLPKDNTLSVMLYWPGDKEYVPGTASAKVQVFVADPDSPAPKPGRMIAEYVWPDPRRPETYPQTFLQPFDAPDVPSTRLWTQAQPLRELSLADRREILRLIEEVRQAIERGDGAAAWERLQYRYTDEAIAEYHTPERLREVVLEQYQWLAERGPLTSRPLEDEQAVFSIVGKDRLVAVTHEDGSPAIVFDEAEGGQGRSFAIPVYAARVEGKWVIAR